MKNRDIGNNTTTIIVQNDAILSIGNDRHFGQNLANAIRANFDTGEQVDIQAVTHICAATVIEQHDQDETVLVAVGARYGSVFSETVSNLIHHTAEAKERILRDVALRMGYFLRKNTGK